VLSNFPIDAFDRRDRRPPGWPTFGVKLIPPLPTANARLFPFTRVLGILPGARHVERLLTTLVVGRDQAYLRQPWVRARTVQVDADAVNPFDFGIEEGKQRLLYSHGRLAAESFLETWDWQRYLHDFRT
jgi:NTE family protein